MSSVVSREENTEIFEGIADKTIHSHIILENEDFLAFLDIFPITKGHTLVISKKYNIDYIFDLPENVYQNLFLFSKEVALLLEKKVSCKRVALSIVGLEVGYAHIHLIPVNNIGDVDFTRPKIKEEDANLLSLAESIRKV